MKIVGENIRETVIKERGQTVYYTNAAGDRVPVMFNDVDGSLKEVVKTTSKRLSSQRSNVTTYNPETSYTPRLWIKRGYGLDTDSGEILVWHDVAENANHLTTASPRPKETRGYAELWGEGDFFSLTQELELTTFTVVVAIRPNGVSKQYITGDSASRDSFLGLGHSAGNEYALGFDTGVVYQGSGTLNDRELQVISFRRDASDDIVVRRNKTEEVSVSGTGEIMTINQIGRRYTDSPTLVADIHEILIYHESLTDSELSGVEDGVMKRNGIDV